MLEKPDGTGWWLAGLLGLFAAVLLREVYVEHEAQHEKMEQRIQQLEMKQWQTRQ